MTKWKGKQMVFWPVLPVSYIVELFEWCLRWAFCTVFNEVHFFLPMYILTPSDFYISYNYMFSERKSVFEGT